MQSATNMLRNLRKVKPAKLLAGIGAVTGLAATAAATFGMSAENSCKSKVKQAYQKFMPVMDYPDLSKHNNCLRNHLTPQLYNKLRDLVSKISSYIQ